MRLNLANILHPGHTGMKVLYECYPHLNEQGGTWIRGTIDGELDEGDEEMFLVIRTHPDDMKHPSLEGCSDCIPVENCSQIVSAEPYDSRSNGPVFCAVCGDEELDDDLVPLGVRTCHDCEVLRPSDCANFYFNEVSE